MCDNETDTIEVLDASINAGVNKAQTNGQADTILTQKYLRLTRSVKMTKAICPKKNAP